MTVHDSCAYKVGRKLDYMTLEAVHRRHIEPAFVR